MNFFRRIYSFDYMGHKRWWFTISAIIIGAGLISLFVKGGGNPLKGLNYGIEFTQGTQISVVFTKPAALGDVRAVVSAQGKLPFCQIGAQLCQFPLQLLQAFFGCH